MGFRFSFQLHWCKIQGINRPECNSDDTEGFDDARVPFIGLSVRPVRIGLFLRIRIHVVSLTIILNIPFSVTCDTQDSVTTYFISFR